MKSSYIQINRSVRIESGPARVTTIVNNETISDRISPSRYQVNKKDAYGQRIKRGCSFTYLDDNNPWVWYVYSKDDGGAYRTVGAYETQQMAEEIAAAVIKKAKGPSLINRIMRRLRGVEK